MQIGLPVSFLIRVFLILFFIAFPAEPSSPNARESRPHPADSTHCRPASFPKALAAYDETGTSRSYTPWRGSAQLARPTIAGSNPNGNQPPLFSNFNLQHVRRTKLRINRASNLLQVPVVLTHSVAHPKTIYCCSEGALAVRQFNQHRDGVSNELWILLRVRRKELLKAFQGRTWRIGHGAIFAAARRITWLHQVVDERCRKAARLDQRTDSIPKPESSLR